METITCVHQVALHCDVGGSDKIYIIQVHQHEDAAGKKVYKAVFFYGARGASLKPVPKPFRPSLSAAMSDANAQERAKREPRGDYNKDYVIPPTGIPGLPAGTPVYGRPPVASTAPATPVAVTPVKPAAPAVVGPAPMLAQDVVDEDHLEALIKDPNWVMQKKYDGERVPVSMRRKGLTASNRTGTVRPLATETETALSRPLARTDFGDDKETLIDGELMGVNYIVYDVLTVRNNDVRKFPFVERFSMLEVLFENEPQLLAECAWNEAEKRAMIARARAEDWEGVIFREINADYANGRSQFLLRFKLWATVTCRVLSTNSKRSVRLGLLEADGSEEFCGNVTVPANQDIPEPDDLVEVRYLYAMDGGSLYQPVLLRVRKDISDADLRSSLRKAPPEKRAKAEPEPLAA